MTNNKAKFSPMVSEKGDLLSERKLDRYNPENYKKKKPENTGNIESKEEDFIVKINKSEKTDLETIVKKTCSKCNTEKSVKEFRKKKIGYYDMCKMCVGIVANESKKKKEVGTKTCIRCSEKKPVTDFRKMHNSTNRYATCKICSKKTKEEKQPKSNIESDPEIEIETTIYCRECKVAPSPENSISIQSGLCKHCEENLIVPEKEELSDQITITIGPKTKMMIDIIKESEFYGTTDEEVVTNLMKRQIETMLLDGSLIQMKEDNAD